MAKYTFILTDEPDGSVSVLVPEASKHAALELAGNLEKATPAFHYMIACMNVLKDRARGITRPDEARMRRGALPHQIIIPK